MAGLDRKRRGELLYAVLDVLAEHPDGLQAKEALAAVEQRIALTEFEKANYPGTEIRRFEKTVRFQTINAVKAGWLIKNKGIWSITEDGLKAHSSFTEPGNFMEEAERLYRAWAKGQPKARQAVEDEDEDAAGVSLTVEKAEEMAWDEVRQHLAAMDPYEFQHLVAGLLRGMGYHVSHVAPPGKDRGVDIIAEPDPLGARGPRVKVQVKREQSKTDAKSLRAFLSVLKANDVGTFVTLGGFTSDAADEARNEARRITLIGPGELFELWVRHYDQIPDEDRRRLPIKTVAFLAVSEPSL
jgi:restriction system protein